MLVCKFESGARVRRAALPFTDSGANAALRLGASSSLQARAVNASTPNAADRGIRQLVIVNTAHLRRVSVFVVVLVEELVSLV